MNYSYLETKAGFKIAGKTDADIVTAGGGTKAVSDFALTGKVIKIDTAGGISNGSDSRSNAVFFEYNWAGTGVPGSVINFSGLNGKYSTELFADYTTGNSIGVRTFYGDSVNSWNPVKWLWHSGNFDPSNYVTLNTPENLLARKSFAGATGNRFDEGAIETRGNGSTIYPSIGFHQPGQYAGTLSLRAGVFCFRNTDDSDFYHIEAKGFIMQGLDDNYFPLAGGGYRQVADFITTTGDYNITGKKWFITTGGNGWSNNTAIIQGKNDYDAGLTFFREGINIGQLIYNGYGFQFKTSDALGYFPVTASAFIQAGGDGNHVLLDDGNSKSISDFALANNAVPYTGANQPVNIGTQNLSTAGSIYAGGFNSTVFVSPTMSGNFVINTDLDTLYFGNSVVSSIYYQAKTAQYFFVNGNLVTSINSTGISVPTGKYIYSDNYFSSTLAGNQILNVATSNVLVLGNDSLPNIYYNVLNNHVFIAGSSVIATINSSGIAITGALSVNTQAVATQNWVNTQLSSYATLAGVQTFTNTITFSQSPVVPSGTLGTHAVNLNQLNSKADKSIVINAGTGLTGGGDLSGNRTLGIDSTTLANIEKGVEAYNYGNHASQGYLKNANGFIFDSLYREIDTDIDLDDTSIKEYHIVFDSSSDAKVTIQSMVDGQTFRISNFSASNTVELWVNGYPVALDAIDAGDTKLYVSHHSGKLRRLSANPTGPII